MPPSPAVAELRRWLLPPVAGVTLPLLFALAAFCWRLWPEWSHNPDLSHGFFTPLIFILLLGECRAAGQPTWGLSAPLLRWATGAVALITFMLFAVAGLLAASVGWSHALVEFLLAASLSAGLLTACLGLAAGGSDLAPLNWTSLTAAGLWLLSAPLPLGTYTRLTLGLQSVVSDHVLQALHFLGIPAEQHGHLIHLATTTVGIEEACSGIRSLLSCLYAGFFFAAWQVRSAWGRALLILAAPLLAVVMNYLRSLTLTLLANAGVPITGFWHDATGFAILGLTALLLGLLALALSPRADAPARVRARPERHTRRPWLGFHLAAGGVAALALVFAFYGRTTAPAGSDPGAVDALLPREAEGWQVRTTENLYQFADILRTTQLAERTYLKLIAGQPVQVTVYVAHWSPGQAPVSLVASHTPDACWPGTGWEALPNPEPHPALSWERQTLPLAEHRLFQHHGQPPLHVWFWHVYDGRVINYRDPYSVPALLELALRYGFRREGGQYFVRLSSNAPWETLAHDPLIRRLFANLAPTGLAP